MAKAVTKPKANNRNKMMVSHLLDFVEKYKLLKKLNLNDTEMSKGYISGILSWGTTHENLKVICTSLENGSIVFIPEEDRFAEQDKIAFIQFFNGQYKIRDDGKHQHDYFIINKYNGTKSIQTSTSGVSLDYHEYSIFGRSQKWTDYDEYLNASGSRAPLRTMRDIIFVQMMKNVPILQGYSALNETILERVKPRFRE